MIKSSHHDADLTTVFNDLQFDPTQFWRLEPQLENMKAKDSRVDLRRDD